MHIASRSAGHAHPLLYATRRLKARPGGLILHVTGALNHIYMHAEHQLRSAISLKDRAYLSRVNTLTRDIDIANLSVCLSVCLSVHLNISS